MLKPDKKRKSKFKYVEWEKGKVLLQKNFGPENNLVFLLVGEIEVIYGNLNPKTIVSRNMLFLSPLSNFVCTTLTPIRCVILEFDSLDYNCDRYVFSDLTPIYSLIKYEFSPLEIREPMNLFLESIISYLNYNIFFAELFVEKVRELIILLRAYYNMEELTMLFYPLLGKDMDFKKMVINYYPQAKGATEYAELCGASLGVFQRKFKDVFGETVYQWMQRQKAEQIKHRLMVMDCNPKDLADEFGFASPAHLNKFCKIWFGMTPSELRQTYLLKKSLK